MIRLAVRCRAQDADRVLSELLELAPGGVEEEHGDGWAEFAVYGAPGELPELPDLHAVAGGGAVEVSSTEIPDDWADRWRDFHRPVVIGNGRLIVRPSWEERAGAEQPAGVVDVVIDPGQAFGTGGHATTCLCLELLLELADRDEATGPLADLGTGSGVLAIAAAKLGWSPVFACDSELASLDAARENALANEVQLDVERMNLRQQAPPQADTVVANLTADLLEAVAERMERAPRKLICSGLLTTQVDRVETAFAALEVEAERRSGDWAALLLRAG